MTVMPGARYDRFVEQIARVCQDDPGRRAALRRGLGRSPERAYTMHATVAQWLPDRTSTAEEFAHYAVAAMIAAQAREVTRQAGSEPTEGEQLGDGDAVAEDRPARNMQPVKQNLGASLAMAVRRPGAERRALSQDTAEKRLHLLVRQSLPGVHRHLPGVVRHVRTLGVAIDWSQLLYDLSRWEKHHDNVAKHWLQDFYRTLHTATATAKE
jgi:CRISPR system Cascade subunit CasB